MVFYDYVPPLRCLSLMQMDGLRLEIWAQQGAFMVFSRLDQRICLALTKVETELCLDEKERKNSYDMKFCDQENINDIWEKECELKFLE